MSRTHLVIDALCLLYGLMQLVNSCAAAGFTPLGDLPGGAFMSEATAVSIVGAHVVGYSVSERAGVGGAKVEAFVWKPDTGICGLGYGDTDAPSWANDVSLLGGYIVGGTGAPDSQAVYWRWSGRAWSRQAVPTTGGTRAEALGVGRGATVGWADVGGERKAFRYEFAAGPHYPPQFDWMGHALGAGDSRAADITREQSVIDETISVGVSGNMPARWYGTAAQALPLPSGATGGGLNAITFDEQTMVGWATFPAGGGQNKLAMRCRQAPHNMMELELLGEGGSSEALDVSSDGFTIVGAIDWGAGDQAFIWSPDDGLRSLQQVLELEHGLNLSGWSLQRATGVTPDGLVIVGSGTNPAGDVEAWRAVLDSNVDLQIDEPPQGQITLHETLTLPIGGRAVDVATNISSAGVLSVGQARPTPGSPELDRDYLVAGFYPQMWSVDLTAQHGPVALTFEYDPSGIVGVETDQLRLYQWDPNGQAWVLCDSVVEPDQSTVAITTSQPSLFVLGLVPEPATAGIVCLLWVPLLIGRASRHGLSPDVRPSSMTRARPTDRPVSARPGFGGLLYPRRVRRCALRSVRAAARLAGPKPISPPSPQC